jgi:phosphonopyruvate decarboxylase
MGGLTTTGRYKNIDLTYILFDNEQNKSTGGQNTYQSHVDYINMAKSSNINTVENVITTMQKFTDAMNDVKNTNELKFVCVKCGLDDETPRPPLDVVKKSKF